MNQHKLLLYGFVFVFSIGLLVIGTIYFQIWIQYIEVVTLVGAVFGLLKLIYESNKTRKLKEAEFISNLNRDFTTNEYICHLYEKLEHDYRYPDEPSQVQKSSVLSFVIYFTFFETLYDFIKKRIVSIKNIDDLFGYRFFIMLNNKVIQEIELTPEITIASYVNIYHLYVIWLKYRAKQCVWHQTKIKKSVVLYQDNLIKKYPHVCKYLSKPIKKQQIQPASFIDVFRIFNIQKHVYKQMIEDKEQDWFQPSKFLELFHIYRHKLLFIKKGTFGIEGYIGLLSLSKKHKLASFINNISETMIIDTVLVSLPFRGLGVQKELTSYVMSLESFTNKTWIATVSPENKNSLINFDQLDFKIKEKDVIMYGGKKRYILIKKKRHN